MSSGYPQKTVTPLCALLLPAAVEACAAAFTARGSVSFEAVVEVRICRSLRLACYLLSDNRASAQPCTHHARLPTDRSLAARVGSRAHLVDAIGDAAATLRGPSPLSTAMLSCLAAAAGALRELPQQVRRSDRSCVVQGLE